MLIRRISQSIMVMDLPSCLAVHAFSGGNVAEVYRFIPSNKHSICSSRTWSWWNTALTCSAITLLFSMLPATSVQLWQLVHVTKHPTACLTCRQYCMQLSKVLQTLCDMFLPLCCKLCMLRTSALGACPAKTIKYGLHATSCTACFCRQPILRF